MQQVALYEHTSRYDSIGRQVSLAAVSSSALPSNLFQMPDMPSFIKISGK
jgi:hypothetical protein